jgi:hypothetical protein
VKWGNPNEQKPMTVPAGATKLVVTFQVNATAAGAYSVNGPANASPYVEVKPPSGSTNQYAFSSTSGVATTANDDLHGPEEKSIASPVAGSWTVTVGGTGNNVHAWVRVVAHFT